MNKSNLLLTIARKGSLITETGFSGYDFCLNTYVGCQFGCAYCYVRWFIKDKQRPWGEFVRRREHVVKRLPKELPDIVGQRLVLGTMTDPYQPEERKHRLTRKALGIISKSKTKPRKIGIFTRSPIILDDIELLQKLPRMKVHFTIPPIPRDVSVKIEQIPIQMNARFSVIKQLKQAGIIVAVNFAPCNPDSVGYDDAVSRRNACTTRC